MKKKIPLGNTFHLHKSTKAEYANYCSEFELDC